MRLSQFISDNFEAILQDWEDFARSLQAGDAMSIEALRDDAARMLRFIVADIESEQTDPQEIAKATGHGPVLPHGQLTAAHDHGVARAVARFSLIELVSEYRALRASVTRRWIEAVPLTEQSVRQLIRFSEAIDQILAEGVAKFTERMDHESDLFTGAVGHDLSNPVNAVVMSAHALAASPNLSAEERIVLRRIKQSADRLSGMLVDLRDFTRTRLAGFLNVDRQPCDVGDVIRSVVDELKTVYPGRVVTVSDTGDLFGMLDSRRIAQLVSNLVANALQHAPGDVTVSACGEGDMVTIEVHNTGRILPPERLRTLFEPLSGPIASRDDARLGLGLYIAQQIARAHKGNIAVTSKESFGTRFTVSLPARGTEISV